MAFKPPKGQARQGFKTPKGEAKGLVGKKTLAGLDFALLGVKAALYEWGGKLKEILNSKIAKY
ncbi:MAG: hypothetical protein LBE49_01425 [Deltaproteobacteria bacterium]|jgi:hypothetical protein|nr:hypothetical protein [Deltaproteobacteria bacterium]